jgi:hypothetical protein
MICCLLKSCNKLLHNKALKAEVCDANAAACSSKAGKQKLTFAKGK